MPIYVYECNKCKRTFEVFQKITDLALTSHLDCNEGHEGLAVPCDGKIGRLIQPCAVIFKGSGWTPKHFTKTGHKQKKVDDALKRMGVEDASEGWSKTSDKDVKVKGKRKRAKKLGYLKLD